MKWLQENYGAVMMALGVAVAVATALNRVSVHWASLEGSWYRRLLPCLLLFITEMLSVMTSVDVEHKRWKLPFTSVRKTTGLKGGARTPYLTVLLVGVLAIGGCSSWKTAAYKGMAIGYKVGAEASSLVKGDQFCRPTVNWCKQQKLAHCGRLDKCQAKQPTANKAFQVYFHALAAAWQSVKVGDEGGFNMITLGRVTDAWEDIRAIFKLAGRELPAWTRLRF